MESQCIMADVREDRLQQRRERVLKTLVYTYSLSTLPVLTVIAYLCVATQHCLFFACLECDCLPTALLVTDQTIDIIPSSPRLLST